MKLKVELHKSVHGKQPFLSIDEVEITKTDLFKHGVMVWPTPEHVSENDFEHLQSKIPTLEGLVGDYIELHEERIVNNVNDDRFTGLTSEVIGVAAGLIYSAKLLKVNPNRLSKVRRPTSKHKYMDYKAVTDGRTVEFEAKGTTSESTANSMIKDILAKKANSEALFKFGTVTVARKPSDRDPSRIIVCDDPPSIDKKSKNPFIESFVSHYLDYLAFIMDSTYYNRFYSKLQKGTPKPPIVQLQKIKGKYLIGNREYIGEFFDRRLIIDNVHKYYDQDSNLNVLFRTLTEKIDRVKCFIGVDKTLLELYNARSYHELEAYSAERFYEQNGAGYIFRDSDGIILVKSVSGSDKQVEESLRESDVKERLSQYVNFLNRTPHECGAPCRSREIEGKPCEKKTYRNYCYFHR